MVIGKIIFMMTPVDVDKVGFYWFLPPRFRGDYDILLSYSIGFERLHRPNSFAKMEFCMQKYSASLEELSMKLIQIF